VFDVKVEIQLQTIMQHAFNFVSRAWVYKSDHAYPATWQDEFRSIARALRKLDRSIAKLHEAVLEAATRGSDHEPLTPFSYQRILKQEFGEDIALEDAVWSTRFLINLHLTSNGQLRTFFRRPDLLALRQRLKELKGYGREMLGGLCDMSANSFFTFWGVRLEAAEQLLSKYAGQDTNTGGA
jgi:hypothetical protein